MMCYNYFNKTERPVPQPAEHRSWRNDITRRLRIIAGAIYILYISYTRQLMGISNFQCVYLQKSVIKK